MAVQAGVHWFMWGVMAVWHALLFVITLAMLGELFLNGWRWALL